MKIGILGSGLMGGKLGILFTRAGHDVVFSYARSEEKLKRLAREAKAMLARARRQKRSAMPMPCSFGTVPSEVFFGVFEARRKAERPSMAYCGDDDSAKHVAATLISDVGFEPVDAGNRAIPGAVRSIDGTTGVRSDGGPEIAKTQDRIVWLGVRDYFRNWLIRAA